VHARDELSVETRIARRERSIAFVEEGVWGWHDFSLARSTDVA
jgi:hypothetical protein